MRFFLSLGLIFLGLSFGVPLSYGESASDAVRQWLLKRNIKEGFDAERSRFVVIDSCERELPSLDSKDFFKTREQMVLIATFSAKAELIGMINRTITSSDSVKLEKDGDAVEQTTISIIDIFSKQILHGCTVLNIDEKYNDGVYSVAVAVAWSKKLEKAALDALSGTCAKTTPDEDDAEWAAWVARTDFSKRLGPAQFTDSHGVYRYAGVGCVDIEGLKGVALLNARRLAGEKAKQALVYSLWADTVAHTRAVTILKERADKDEEKSDVLEDFVSSVSQECKQVVLKRDVFKGKVVHPLTGRTMYVHVAGIDPAILVEQKVLKASK